jgi:hypothetical protein
MPSMKGVVLDVETQRLFRDVKARLKYLDWESVYDPELDEHDKVGEYDDTWRSMVTRRLRLALAVTWDRRNSIRIWTEPEANELASYLRKFPYVVGANLVSFDYCVLQRYAPDIRESLAYRTIDILTYARWGLYIAWLDHELSARNLGPDEAALAQVWGEVKGSRRFEPWEPTIADRPRLRVPRTAVSLNTVAPATIDIQKSGKSTDAPSLFMQGRMGELADYCARDVELTRDIFQAGLRHGVIRVKAYDAPVHWRDVASRLETIHSPPPLLEHTEPQAALFQWSLIPNVALVETERAIQRIRGQKQKEAEASRRSQLREWRQQERERLRRNPVWIARQQELTEIRRLRQNGLAVPSKQLALDFKVSSSTVLKWAKTLGISPMRAGACFFTLGQARVLRRYGAARPSERLRIAEQWKKRHRLS